MKKQEIQTITRLLNNFNHIPILVIGDIMMDQFIWGDVSRISPEAPVPVLEKKTESMAPGGAGNVVNNLRVLGAEVFAAGVIGNDQHGQELLQILRARDVHTEGILLDDSRPTTVKTRIIARHQQLLRLDNEKNHVLGKKYIETMISYVSDVISRCKGVIISDYGKGVVTPQLLKTVIRCARKYHIPITVDPKIEHFQRYTQVTCMTPNFQEACQGMNRFRVDTEQDLEELGKSIIKKLDCDSVLITRGEKGMSLFVKNRKPVHISATAREVFDVTGAGDTVISVLTAALACGSDILTAAQISNFAAGIVVGKIGTATVSPDEIREKVVRFTET